MNKYLAQMTIGAGMRSAEVVEANSESDADDISRQLCIDLADSYGYYQDMEYFGDLDQVYNENSWEDDDEAYTDTGELEYWVELYDEAEHDGLF